ncbi:MAG: D-alanyl-D-alanine carboxypeptidase [Clostridia bacterium]|nr:D-alanyl-D-alanine carboxypeptidase [Clostridia bacterium]
MKRKLFLRQILTSLTALLLSLLCVIPTAAEENIVPITETASDLSDLGVEDGSLGFSCKSVILMEETTGAILYKQNADEALPPASVTKIMTLLLVMEAIDAETVRLDDTVTVSPNAASMGGSQVYLKEGEQMTVEDLLKSVVIASANDAAVALAEHIAGSVPVFVDKMNARAQALGMKNTVFENVTGLDDTAERHLTSARDIALMSRALIAHETVLKYSSIWMDSIRNGEFGLTNTNRLVRFYPGCTGLKTGSTSKAGFCVSVTAERDGFSLICVVMGAESRDERNAIATQALDWGFANYGLYTAELDDPEPIAAVGGRENLCKLSCGSFSCVLPKQQLSSVVTSVELPKTVTAPIKAGDKVGSVRFFVGDHMIGEAPVIVAEDLPRINFFEVLIRMFARFLLI